MATLKESTMAEIVEELIQIRRQVKVYEPDSVIGALIRLDAVIAQLRIQSRRMPMDSTAQENINKAG